MPKVRRLAVVVLAVALLAIVASPAASDIDPIAYSFSTSTQAVGVPVASTDVIGPEIGRPYAIASYFPVDHLFARARDATSPVTPAPRAGDVVSRATLQGDLAADGCGASDPDGSDSASALGLWNEPFDNGTGDPSKVAEIKFSTPGGDMFLSVAAHEPWGEGDFIPPERVGVLFFDGGQLAPFDALLCTSGDVATSPWTLRMDWFDFARTIVDANANPPVLSAPTPRVFQANPSIGGTYVKCLDAFVGSSSITQRTACTTYSVLPETPTDVAVAVGAPRRISSTSDGSRFTAQIRNVGKARAYAEVTTLAVLINGVDCNTEGTCEVGSTSPLQAILDPHRGARVDGVWNSFVPDLLRPGDSITFRVCVETRARLDTNQSNNCSEAVRTVT